MRNKVDALSLWVAVWSLIGVLALGFMAYMIGYGLGFYSAPCSLDSAQPRCVQAGWGHAVRIESGQRKP